jgi:acyl dehydratase
VHGHKQRGEQSWPDFTLKNSVWGRSSKPWGARSAKTQFGQRVAHGLLGLSVATGLIMRTGMLEGTVLAFREITDWKFVKPFFIGDSIHAVLTVAETKALPRIGGGSLIASVEVKNQKEEICQRGTLNLLVLSKPKE